MKLIIDIPNGVYELLKTDDTELSKILSKATVGNILLAVADGIPLEAQSAYVVQVNLSEEYMQKAVAEAVEKMKAEIESQPSEYCISREAVEEITFQEPSYTDPYNVLTEVRDKVRALPPVTPERPKGEWIHREDMDYLDENKVMHIHFMCQDCGFIHDFIDGHTTQYKYCPSCGRYNGGEEE